MWHTPNSNQRGTVTLWFQLTSSEMKIINLNKLVPFKEAYQMFSLHQERTKTSKPPLLRLTIFWDALAALKVWEISTLAKEDPTWQLMLQRIFQELNQVQWKNHQWLWGTQIHWCQIIKSQEDLIWRIKMMGILLNIRRREVAHCNNQLSKLLESLKVRSSIPLVEKNQTNRKCLQ